MCASRRRATYLVGRVADADVKVGQIRLDHVAEQDLEALLLGLALDALGELGGHPGIQLDGHDLLGLFEDPSRQVARSGADFEDDLEGAVSYEILEDVESANVALFKIGLVDDGLRYPGIFEDVLS